MARVRIGVVEVGRKQRHQEHACQVRIYVGRLQTAHGTRVTHRRDARLEAGRVQ
jgi:hypothetical protein